MLQPWCYRSKVKVGGHVLCLHGNQDSGTVVFELEDGSVYSYREGQSGCGGEIIMDLYF